MASWNHNLDVFNEIKHYTMSFSFEAFRNVQICLVSLLQPNGRSEDAGSLLDPEAPGTVRLAPDHIQG